MLNKLFSPRYLFYTNTALGISFYSLGDCIHQNLDRLYNHQTTSKSESSKSWYDADRTGNKMMNKVSTNLCHRKLDDCNN